MQQIKQDRREKYVCERERKKERKETETGVRVEVWFCWQRKLEVIIADSWH